MKELFKSSSLILFLGLLLVLSISIHFGNRTTIGEGFTPKDAGYQMTPAEIECYRNRNPDLKDLNVHQLQNHWTDHGARENRNNQCTPLTPKEAGYQMTPTEIECYRNRHNDLKDLTAQQLQDHWTRAGARENRNNQCEPTAAPTTTALTAAPTTPNPLLAAQLEAAKLAAKNLGKSNTTAPIKKNKKHDKKHDKKYDKKHDKKYEEEEDEDEYEEDYKRYRKHKYTPPDQPNVTPNPISDYYNWVAFWNTVANSNDPNAMFQSSNYIPKTSVVPHVCPNCPQRANAGANAGVCTSCGGQGGSGTTSTYKNKFADFLAVHGNGYKGDGKWDSRGPGLGRLAEEAGSGAVDLTKTVLNDATGLARDTGSGVKGFLEDTGSGAVGLLKDTGSGAVGLLKDTSSGAVGLLKDTGSGVAGILKSNPAQLNNPYNGTQNGQGGQGGQAGSSVNSPYQSGYYSQGTYNLPNNPLGIQGIDPYSYNGALVQKGSNYIPITDDFSAFRK